MNTKISIKLKKRTQAGYLIWFLFIMPFAFGLLMELLPLPGIVKYTLDVAWLFLLVLLVINSKRGYEEKSTTVLLFWIIGFLIVSLIVYILNYQSILYYLWGVRNNFRFYVLFFAVSAFLTTEDIDDYLNLFDKLFWVNAVVCLIQYFLLGYKGDFLGGLFGNQQGCNSYANIFFIIVVTKSIIYYLNNKESLFNCASKCIAVLILASMTELKFFFVEFALIIIVSVFVTEFTWKKILIVSGGMVGLVFGIWLVGFIFPFFADFFTLETMLETATNEQGYTMSGTLNRLTAIGTISDKFFDSLSDNLFGFGLGNCETANYDILTTPFFLNYYKLGYTWFSTAFLFLEMGYFGLFFYFMFFIFVVFFANKIKKRNPNKKIYCQISMIMAISCILIAVYNSSLRMESGYMAFFALAMPFVRTADISVKR